MVTFGFQITTSEVVTLTFDEKEIELCRALKEFNLICFSKTKEKHWINPRDSIQIDCKQKVYAIKRVMCLILGYYPKQLDCLPVYEDDKTRLKGLGELISWD